jgi:HSP20 family protein
MAVFRWGHSWGHSIGDLEREVDRLLRGVTASFQGLRFGRQYPAINLYELDDEFLLTAELPGMSPDDLEVKIAGGVLTVGGSRQDEDHGSEHRFRRQERAHGSWQRSLSLPDRVRDDGLSAELTDGILRIRLPKDVEEKPRQIPVTSG